MHSVTEGQPVRFVDVSTCNLFPVCNFHVISKQGMQCLVQGGKLLYGVCHLLRPLFRNTLLHIILLYGVIYF